MARRGDELREHVLWTAKDVFLEMGFARASMDEVASRAATSKRTLYAHFENKERLFLAVIELVRGLFLTRLREPGEYSRDATEAITLYCGQYLHSMLYEPSVQMSRISMAESERFPEQAALYFDVLFTQPQERLCAYLRKALGLSAKASADVAQSLLAQVLYPRRQRALFGLDPSLPNLDSDGAAIDLRPIRRAVRELMEKHPAR